MIDEPDIVLPACVALLRCGSEQGSAFFVKPDLAITTRHSILENLIDPAIEILVDLRDDGGPLLASVCDPLIPETEDIVFLRPARPVDVSRVLPLMASHLPRDLRWECFGFPGTRVRDGAHLRGIVSRTLPSGVAPRDVELECDNWGMFSSYKGYSGAPIVTGHHVTAVLQRQLDGALGAISILRLRPHLDAADVAYESLRNTTRLPLPLREALRTTIPNSKTFGAIEEAVCKTERGYLILSGNPGSGKTLITAGFQPSGDRVLVSGRYFCDVNDRKLPAEYYRDAGTFAEWLAAETALVSEFTVASAPAHSMRDHIRTINKNLEALSAYCRTQKKIGVLFIDDAQPVSESTSSVSLLRAMPQNCPEGLVIVLSVSNHELIKRALPEVEVSAVISVTPLERYDCERFARRSLGSTATESTILQITDACGGNPLILSYLIREADAILRSGGALPDDLFNVVTTSAETFYDRQWRRLASSDSAMWFLAVIARLRSAARLTEVIEMLPDVHRAGAPAALATIRHLIHEGKTGVQIYHTSFRIFIKSRTSDLDLVVHDHLAKYCASATKSLYALENVVYHHLLGFEQSRSKALDLCTQDWLDEAAVWCVPPAYVLADTEELLRRRLGQGDFIASIRLLLLRSRLRFRYNNVFTIFAADLGAVTLSLRDAQAALAFVIRNGQIVCSTDEIVPLICRLLHHGYKEEATELYYVFRRICFSKYESDSGTLSILMAHIEATALLGPALGTGWIVELKRLFKIFELNIARKKTSEASFVVARARMHALPMALVLWQTGWMVSPTRVKEENPRQYCAEIAFTLGRSEDLRRRYGNSRVQGNDPPEDKPGLMVLAPESAAVEIEEVSRAAGVLDGAEIAIADILIQYGRAPDLVLSLASNALGEPRTVSLRGQNGVDLDHDALSIYYFAAKSAAYTQDSSLQDRLPRRTRHVWEKRFWDAIEWVGHVAGRRHRQRRDNVSPDKRLVDEMTAELLPLVTFSLTERVSWEDSYDLPETILPQIYTWVAEIIVAFEPTSASEFFDRLRVQFGGQLGVYTEGFRLTLSKFADELGVTDVTQGVALDVQRALFEHIKRCTLNRLERIPLLLQCAKAASDLGSKELAEEAFACAIDASSGPSWYKEGQFGLLLDTLTAIDDLGVTREHWRDAVEVLELASGDLTFQRFVRYAKQDLLHHLASVGLVGDALRLFLHYVHPSVAVQKRRIAATVVDRVDEVTGNRFGVLEVDEQAGALALLANFSSASSLRRWALVEFFLPGDDRYFDRFAKLTNELLATEDGERIGARLIRLLRADFHPSKRTPFVTAMRSTDSRGTASRWMSEAEALGILDPKTATESGKAPFVDGGDRPTPTHQATRGDSDESNDELLLPGTFGRRAGVRALKEHLGRGREQLAVGNKAGARQSFVRGLEAAQVAGWGIWTMSDDSRRALDALLRETGGVAAAISVLCSLIMNEEYAADWSIAQSLIESGLPALPREARAEVLSIVIGHFRCVLRPEYEQGDAKYETALLVALLDHPNQYARGRAADIIMWLAQQGPDAFDISRLQRRVVSTEIGYGRELAAGMLHGLSLTCPHALDEALLERALISQMLSDSNFIVRYAADGIAQRMGIASDSDDREAVAAVTPDDSSSVAEDRSWTWQRDTDAILKIDGNDDSRRGARRWLESLCADESPEHAMALWKVRRAGFGCHRSERWSTPWEREAAFRAVHNINSAEERERLAEEAMWNPMWPDGQLRMDWRPLSDRLRDRLVRCEYEGCFVVNGKILLHYLELVKDDRQETMKIFEAVAFLVPSVFFNGHFDLDALTERCSVHGVVSNGRSRSRLARISEAAVITFKDRPRIGGKVTPARPTTRLLEVTGLPEESFERVCWRDGRFWDPWGVGPPISQGCALLMNENVRITLSDVVLAWVVFEDGQPRVVVDPIRRSVYPIGGQ